LYPRTEKTFSVVFHNARNVAALYPTTAKKLKLKYIHENNFSAK
jgi:hypothetical protein